MAKKKLPMLGDFIKKRLYIMGKTQIWLAEQCGCNKAFISQIVMGKSKPNIMTDERIPEAVRDEYKEKILDLTKREE